MRGTRGHTQPLQKQGKTERSSAPKLTQGATPTRLGTQRIPGQTDCGQAMGYPRNTSIHPASSRVKLALLDAKTDTRLSMRPAAHLAQVMVSVVTAPVMGCAKLDRREVRSFLPYPLRAQRARVSRFDDCQPAVTRDTARIPAAESKPRTRTFRFGGKRRSNGTLRRNGARLQAGYGLHGKKKTASNRGKHSKPEMLVELRGSPIHCVHCHRVSSGNRLVIASINPRTLCRTSTASTTDGSSTSPGYRNIHAYFVNSTISSMSGSSVRSTPTAWLPNFPKSCVLGNG